MMNKFLIRSLPYLAIGLIFGGIGEFFLIQSKESTTIETVTDIQSKSSEELYYGREILGNSLSNYKYQMFIKTQPKVLVLGQSVTLQFRDFVFEPYDQDFYNTGLMARNAKDLNYVLDLFESGEVKKPKLLLLGMDFSFVLQDSFLDETEWTRHYPADRAESAKSHIMGMQRAFLSPKLRRRPLGDAGFGRAGMRGRGYRNDGSYRHKPEIEAYLKDSTYVDGKLITHLSNRSFPFTEPFSYSEAKAKGVLETLQRINDQGIEVLLYVPPYSSAFFEVAIKDELFASFWKDYMSFQQLLKDEGYNLIPFCTPNQIGLTDDYMVDAEHPGEVMCAIQLRNFVTSGQAKGALLNSLTFKTIEEHLNAEQYIPVSFLLDSLSVQYVRTLKLKRN